MQTLAIIDAEKAFAVLEANGETIPTAMRARVEMGEESPFVASQLEIYDTTLDAADVIMGRLYDAFSVGSLACNEHDGNARDLFARECWALSPGIAGLVAHHDGATTFGRSWERAVPVSLRMLGAVRARIYVLRPLDDGEARAIYTPREVTGDAGEADRILLAKRIVAETGTEYLDHIERRFGISDMAAGAEIDRLAFVRQYELIGGDELAA